MKQPILKMYESGQLNQILSKWEPRKPNCQHKAVEKLSFQKLFSLFSILSIGIILALSVITIENCLKKKYSNTETDQKTIQVKRLLGELEEVLKNGKISEEFSPLLEAIRSTRKKIV